MLIFLYNDIYEVINVDKLEVWYEKIKDFDRLTLDDARELLNKANSTSDENLKKLYMDKVILGTLYVVYNNIKTVSLNLLANSVYDMDDIINTYNELWIREIRRGRLFEIEAFSRVFKRGFFSKLNKILCNNEYVIRKETCIIAKNLKNYFYKYLELRNMRDDITVDEFLEFIDDDYLNSVDYIERERLFILLERIYENMNFDKVDDCNLSKTNFDHIKYLFIDSTLEVPIPREYSVSYEDEVINKIYMENIMEFIENSNLDEARKQVLSWRFGLDDDKKTIRDIGLICGKKGEIIRRREAEALYNLRRSATLKKLVKY